MPTVLRRLGYRFHFYSGDGEEPPHVHVSGDGGQAKVWLDPVTVARRAGWSDLEIRRILAIVAQEQEAFLAAWHDHFRLS